MVLKFLNYMAYEMSIRLTPILLPVFFPARQSYAGFCTIVYSILAFFGRLYMHVYIFLVVSLGSPYVANVAMVLIESRKQTPCN